MHHYSIFKLNLDGSLSNRENVGHDELGGAILSLYGKYATIKVIRDDGNYVVYTDNGVDFVVSEKGVC